MAELKQISKGQYRAWTENQWRGRKVRSLKVMRNGLAELPPGTVFTIRYKFKGFDLVTEPCACCGIRIFIGKVAPGDLVLLPAEDDLVGL